MCTSLSLHQTNHLTSFVVQMIRPPLTLLIWHDVVKIIHLVELPKKILNTVTVPLTLQNLDKRKQISDTETE